MTEHTDECDERQIVLLIESRVTAIVLGIAAALTLVAGIHYSSPQERCMRQQVVILLRGNYQQVPERADYAAKVFCERNSNVPGETKFAFGRPTFN